MVSNRIKSNIHHKIESQKHLSENSTTAEQSTMEHAVQFDWEVLQSSTDCPIRDTGNRKFLWN